MKLLEGFVPKFNVVCIAEHYGGHSHRWVVGDIFVGTITNEEAVAIKDVLNALHNTPHWVVKEAVHDGQATKQHVVQA